MEQHALKNVSISFYLDASDGQNSNLYLSVVLWKGMGITG